MDIIDRRRDKAIKKIAVKAGVAILTWYAPITMPLICLTWSALNFYAEYMD